MQSDQNQIREQEVPFQRACGPLRGASWWWRRRVAANRCARRTRPPVPLRQPDPPGSVRGASECSDRGLSGLFSVPSFFPVLVVCLFRTARLVPAREEGLHLSRGGHARNVSVRLTSHTITFASLCVWRTLSNRLWDPMECIWFLKKTK